MKHWSDKLPHHACPEAKDWAKTQPSFAAAWRNCERGDWMLWLLGMQSGDPGSNRRRRLVLCACECARLALHYLPKGELRPRMAIETAERWARREGATLDDVRAAAIEAAYAASITDADSAADAAYAAAYAAAYTAANAAASAAHAAVAMATPPSKAADVVRKHYPKPPRLGATP